MDQRFQPLLVVVWGLSLLLLALLLRFIWVVLRRGRNAPPAETPRDLLMETLREQTLLQQAEAAGRQQTVLALESLSSLHAAVMDHLPAGVLVFDADGCLTFANPSAMNFLNLESVSRQEPNAVHPALASWFYREDPEGEVLLEDAAVNRCFDASRVALDDGGTLVTLNDRTVERTLESQLRYKRDVAVMGELAGGIAHEVKNALGVIQGRVQMLQYGDVPMHAGKIRDEIDRLLYLLREFMRGRSDRFDSRPLDLANVLKKLAERWQGLPDGERVIIQVLEPGHAMLQGDPDQLLEAFHNLVTNGMEACRDAGVTDSPWVEVAAEARSGCWFVTVRDVGPGIADSVRSKLFVPFVSTKEDGNGLGLFHCRRIFMLHGADLELAPGPPTRFVCRFVEAQSLDPTSASSH